MSQPPTKRRWVERTSQRFRDRRAGKLKAVLLAAKHDGRPVEVLDLGGRFEFWRRLGLTFLSDNGIKVTILNLTSVEGGGESAAAHGISFVVGDACATGLPDHAYDVVISNSVIEHVITWQNMIAFAGEMRRTGKSYYCQTPNYWFPIDPHYYKVPFFHWLPRPSRAWLLRHFRIATAGKAGNVLKSYQMVDAARLLTRTQMAALFPDADLHAERMLGLFVKSYTAIAGDSRAATA